MPKRDPAVAAAKKKKMKANKRTRADRKAASRQLSPSTSYRGARPTERRTY